MWKALKEERTDSWKMRLVLTEVCSLHQYQRQVYLFVSVAAGQQGWEEAAVVTQLLGFLEAAGWPLCAPNTGWPFGLIQ